MKGNWVIKMFKAKDYNIDEFDLYEKAKMNPESIDSMTEYSTDWQKLENKYKGLTRKSVEEIIENPKAWDDAGEWIQGNLLTNDEKSQYQIMGD